MLAGMRSCFLQKGTRNYVHKQISRQNRDENERFPKRCLKSCGKDKRFIYKNIPNRMLGRCNNLFI